MKTNLQHNVKKKKIKINRSTKCKNSRPHICGRPRGAVGGGQEAETGADGVEV